MINLDLKLVREHQYNYAKMINTNILVTHNVHQQWINYELIHIKRTTITWETLGKLDVYVLV